MTRSPHHRVRTTCIPTTDGACLRQPSAGFTLIGLRKPSLSTVCLSLGDQLNRDSTVFDDSDKARDAVVMLEVAEEAEYVPPMAEQGPR